MIGFSLAFGGRKLADVFGGLRTDTGLPVGALLGGLSAADGALTPAVERVGRWEITPRICGGKLFGSCLGAGGGVEICSPFGDVFGR